MLFFRYHAPHRRGEPEGWQQASRPSERRPYQEQYRDWEVEVTRRRVGVTIRRYQHRAVIRRQDQGAEHLITGFPSEASAVDAARQWIDRQESRQRIARQRLRARLRRHPKAKPRGS